MFQNAESFNHSIERWNVSNVTNMDHIFDGAIALTLANNPLGRWNALREIRRSKPVAVARVDSNVKIARTTEEYMSMCRSAEKTADECMNAICPICFENILFKGHLVRPVMFHKTSNTSKEIWVDPVHPEEQVRWGKNCTGCRAELFIPQLQKDDILREHPQVIEESVSRTGALRLQSVIRGHMSRKKPNSGGKKRSNRRKHARHNKRTRKGSRMHKKMH
jgi:surface protein